MPVGHLKIGSVVCDLSKRTYIMGVLNVTPDSFSDGGNFAKVEKAVAHGVEMAREGADIIDIGGETTKPGSDRVSEEVELDRVIPVIEKLAKEIDKPISIDTTKAVVARKAIEAGASLINDISGLQFDPEMVAVMKATGVPAVVMHTADDPKVMQQTYKYDDVVEDIYQYFNRRLEDLESEGISRDRIILDPGIGFGKSVEHNLSLIRNSARFNDLGCPVLIGPSRKSFIGAILDVPVTERLNGTLASLAVAVMSGAQMVRVHDVVPAIQVCRMADAFMGKSV